MREETDVLSQRPRGYGADTLTSSFRDLLNPQLVEPTQKEASEDRIHVVDTQHVDYVSEQECTPLAYK